MRLRRLLLEDLKSTYKDNKKKDTMAQSNKDLFKVIEETTKKDYPDCISDSVGKPLYKKQYKIPTKEYDYKDTYKIVPADTEKRVVYYDDLTQELRNDVDLADMGRPLNKQLKYPVGAETFKSALEPLKNNVTMFKERQQAIKEIDKQIEEFQRNMLQARMDLEQEREVEITLKALYDKMNRLEKKVDKILENQNREIII